MFRKEIPSTSLKETKVTVIIRVSHYSLLNHLGQDVFFLENLKQVLKNMTFVCLHTHSWHYLFLINKHGCHKIIK